MATDLIDPRRPNWTIPPKQAVPTATSARPTLGSLKPLAVPSADTLAAGAGGMALAAGVNSLRQGALNTAAPVAPMPDAPGQIPVDTRLQAPPAAAGSLLNQSEVGRNVGNIVNATTGLRLPAGGLDRVASAVASRVAAPAATRAAAAAPTVAAAGKGYVAGDAAFPGVAPERAAPASVVAPLVRQPYSDARNGTYAAPDNAPGLTGKIVRDGNSYSGKDVKFGADIVNPRSPGVGVTSLDTSEGYRQNLLELQRNAAERASAPGPGGVAGIGTRGGSMLDDLVAKGRGDPLEKAMREASPRGRLRLAEAMKSSQDAAAAREMQGSIASAQNAATLRGQEITADTSRANTRDSISATLRGQDMDYAEKLDSKKMDLAARREMRLAQGQAWANAGGDPRKYMANLAAAGLPLDAGSALVSSMRADTEASAKGAADTVRGSSVVTGKDGIPTVSEGLVAKNVATADKMIPGYSSMTREQQAANAAQVNSGIRLRDAANAARGEGLLQKLGFDNRPFERDMIPSVDGYTFERLGTSENFNPFTFTGKGDLEGTAPGKPKLRLKADGLTEYDLKMVDSMGGRFLRP